MKEVEFMQKSRLIVLVLIFTLLFSINVKADSDLDIDFFIRLFSVDQDKVDYFASFDISNDNLSTILYLYSNADRTLTRNQFRDLMRENYSWRELSIYFGLPPIMFDDDVIKLRRPNRNRIQVPLGRKRYQKKYKSKNIEERVNLNPGKYEYYYRDKLRGTEEKIEVKQNKYEYYYKSNYMEEKLEVHMVTNKYEYYYKNFYSGREIKKEGRGRPIDSDRLYRELKEKIENKEKEEKNNKDDDDDSGINFSFKIKFNF